MVVTGNLPSVSIYLKTNTVFVNYVILICYSAGRGDGDVELLEGVVSSFPTCGTVGLLDIPDLEVGEHVYKKTLYLNIMKMASERNESMCGK